MPSHYRSHARAAARSSEALALGVLRFLAALVASVATAAVAVSSISVSAIAATPPIVAIPLPVLAPPALPTTPVGRSLAGAYGAIVTAGARDPFAAQEASFAYTRALQQARVGNVAGALAAANEARAEALSGAAPGLVPPIAPIVPQPFAGDGASPNVPPALGVPLVAGGVPLSPDLENARDEIGLASREHGRNLTVARAHYRRALDAYVSGDAATSRVEARAAFDAAASGVPAPK